MKITKLSHTALLAALVATSIPTVTLADSVVTYEEKDTGSNMGESFVGSATVVYGQTPSFTVKIPKAITLDEDGSAKYTVGVKGQIPSKYTVRVVPDETTVMKEENGLLDDIIVDITASKTEWTAAELDPDAYNENTDNIVQMQSVDYGKFEGNLNFDISAEASNGADSEVDDGIEAGSEVDLENFTYSLNDADKTITLSQYGNGTKSEVVIYGKYEVSGKVYDTVVTTIGEKGLFYNDCDNYGNNIITSIVFKNGVKAVGSLNDMFNSCQGLTSIDFSGLDTSEVTDMSCMFSCCDSLTELDLTNFDTSNVTNMSYMFVGCSSLTSIKVSSATWVEPENKSDMFIGCGVSSVTKV